MNVMHAVNVCAICIRVVRVHRVFLLSCAKTKIDVYEKNVKESEIKSMTTNLVNIPYDLFMSK